MEAAKSLRSCSLHFFHIFIFSFAILFLMSSIPTVSAKTSNSSCIKTYKSYIKTACKSATYQKDCYKSLSPYASTIKTDPEKLYKVTLYITIRAARETSSSISSLWRLKDLTPTERGIIRDCAETVSDAIDELKQSLTVMTNLRSSSDRRSEMENVRSWVSAALTDQSTCTDQFDGQTVSNAVNKNIKKTVLNLARMTSNCLALVDAVNY
ncbi:Pectinesterase inhibitor domain - like 10 [Theobroma cacao]|uniref:pectinesterase n=1 Tax=Theobroma cacao TaxID=3641 RepID=A0AB32W4Q9_THECC|nr:PREDICTED: 21 kDa protein [Theobroma cacao]WRX16963.1 Pectinesterase inhibitor domain - like 10 [Theobroma cacao]